MLLLLAGSGEARRIAQALADAGIAAVASLAGATRSPEPLALPTRIGGFGGRDRFEAYLTTAGITAILDATHPFANQISLRTADVAAERRLPYLQLLRAEWQPGPGDAWTLLQREEDAADHIPPGATVFLATGSQTLARFANLAGRRLICRQIDPPEAPFPFADGEFLIGRPPFSVEDEIALFRKLSIDWLVVKNAGGVPSRSKLDAARELGLPVVMIQRPLQPEAPNVATIAAALDWARALPW